MILTERTINIIDHESIMDSPVVLYRGDKNVELKLNIKSSRFKFRDDDSSNFIESAQASYGQLIIQTPNQNEPIFSEITATKKGYIIFVITAEMIDEIDEVGAYTFQVRLLDSNKRSRATIPPVVNGIEIREPITSEDSNVLNSAVVGLASAANEEVLDTFDEHGDYAKTNWKFGDKITAAKLKKAEDGIYQSYALGLNNSSQLKNKVSKGEGGVITNVMLSQEVKEAMTGGSVAVVGKDTILTENIVDGQITNNKIKDNTISEDKLRKKGYYETVSDLKFEYHNQYIDNSGVLQNMDKWHVTYPIVNTKMPIKIICDSTSLFAGVWLDDSLNFTEKITCNITDNGDGTYIYLPNAPTNSNSVYLRLNYCSDNISSIKFYEKGIIGQEHLKDGIISLNNLSSDFKITTELLKDNCVTGEKISKAGVVLDMTNSPIEYTWAYLDDKGNLNTNGAGMSDWNVTSLLNVSRLEKIIYKSSQRPFLLGCFFDQSNNFIENITYKTSEEDGVFTSTINCDGFEYIRLNTWGKTVSIIGILKGAIDNEHLKNKCISKEKLGDDVLELISGAETISSKKYIDLDYTRQCISDFLEKWNNKEMLNVVCIGDSITNFQNSEILDIENQKIAPLGLQGNSWVRRLWKMLNYDVYNDDRTIKNENGNLGYKRYDHSDFNFDGGYQGTANSVGDYKWATNRNDSSDSWRNVSYAGYTQVITSESTFNKMMVGSNVVGATCSVTIPSNAIGMSIIFGGCSCVVNVKINNGSSNVIDTNVTLSGESFELHKEFAITSGTNKTVTITLTSGTVWLYGVEYWVDNCVRVINSGLAGNSVDNVNKNFNKLMKGFNGDLNNVDLVVWEVNALNDARNLLSSTRTNAKAVFEQIKALNIPILTIMTHRHQKGQVTLQYDRYNPIYDTSFTEGSKFVGYQYFYPDYIRLYRTLSYKYGAGIIDMYSKSVDICGGLMNDATFPNNFFVDGIHLGNIGNDCYEEELKKVFLWNDYE